MSIPGLLTIEVQGFEPAFAQKLARAVLEETERFVSENAHRIARERMVFSEGEVERTAALEQKAHAAVLAFQTQHKLLDPLSQATANSTLTAALQATQAKQEADLKAALACMSEDNQVAQSAQPVGGHQGSDRGGTSARHRVGQRHAIAGPRD
jgi:capsular polysaccharide transport system permease protein